jgi:hypothetical protein
LDETTIARLREYLVPTIEIELNENTSLNEMINLFVDINQYGVKVNRLNIVRAMKHNDPLLKDVYDMIAERQTRRQDVFTRRKKTAFGYVLKKLNIISTIADGTVQADRMWEKLLELALFVRSDGKHRKPTEILKSFIVKPDIPEKISKEERKKLNDGFDFLRYAYKKSPSLEKSRLATDQTHFYTMATALLSTDILTKFTADELTEKLTKFATRIEKPRDSAKPAKSPVGQAMARYRELSTEKTTDASRRSQRQQEMVNALELL